MAWTAYNTEHVHMNPLTYYEQTGNLDGANKLIGMYPNYSWLPFCVLVNWDYDELLALDRHTIYFFF